MKKFANEFKVFISRGNVVDMAVGVIVGSAFTAIVTAVSDNVFKPLINWMLALIFKTDTLSEIYTFLKEVYVVDEAGNITPELDLAQSIYIDWGALINAVLNFFLIAFILFSIVKIINKFHQEGKELSEKIAEMVLDRGERRELRAAGVNIRDRDAVRAYFAEKKRLEAEKKAREAAAAEEARRLEREANPTAEDLLKQILAELRKNQ